MKTIQTLAAQFLAAQAKNDWSTMVAIGTEVEKMGATDKLIETLNLLDIRK